MGNSRKIIWLSVKEGTPARGYWDQRMLEEFFKDETHIVCDYTDSFYSGLMPDVEDPIIVIPGAYQSEYIDRINEYINHYKKCTVIITSDEENKFPIDDLSHPNMRVFAENYNPKYESDITWLPIGPANRFDLPLYSKTSNFVFSGQANATGRKKYIEQLKKRSDGMMFITAGFAQGMPPENYYRTLASAKVAPSPVGAVCPDAFRTWEAIEAGAVPIPFDSEWHHHVLGDTPFPIVDDYEQVNGYINDVLERYPSINNETQMWWLRKKREYKNMLIPPKQEGITVVIPCSPVKSHPDTYVIDETISTIRAHLPYAEIIVTFDGVRKEQEDRKKDYEEFKRRFLWKCFNEYKNVLPVEFKEHSHQVKMAREALKVANTDLILYCEQDTPLTPDMIIEWKKCAELIRSGEANMIRFHFEAEIPKPHKYMMIGEPENGFLRTAQWSQRPHLISKAYFKRVLDNYFTEDAICFIEDKMHGILWEDYKIDKMNGWLQHRVWIYHPEGNIKRSYHTDGRAGEEKYDNTQVW